MNYILEHTQTILFFMEIVGTIAFASSGAMTAIQKQMDIFGINVLAIVTSVGGGMIRDLLIGNTPPVMFRKPVYTIVAMITCNLMFLLFFFYRKLLENRFMVTYEKLMLIFDAIGLGIFTVTGVSTGMQHGYQDNTFLLIFLGVITGVGGGMIRDVLATQKPYILVKHIYACASIAGTIICILLWPLGDIAAMMLGAATVILIRFLAMTFKWNLPKLQ